MKNALVYMTFLFLLTGMLSGCTEGPVEEPVEAPEDEGIEMEVEVNPTTNAVEMEVTVGEAEDTAEDSDAVEVEVEIEEETEVESVDMEVEVEEEADASTTVYADGSYSRAGSYNTPAGTQQITVSLTVKDDVVTGVNIFGSSDNETTQQYIDLFAAGIPNIVNGVRLEDLDGVSAVNGSSLTGGAFNSALAQIKAAAQN